MLPRKPHPPLRHAPPQHLNIRIALLQPDLKITITAIARQLVIRPGSRQHSHRLAGLVPLIIIRQARIVRREEAEKLLRRGGRRVVRILLGQDVGEVLGGGAEGVEEQGGVGGATGQGGHVDALLVPGGRVGVARVERGGPLREAWVMVLRGLGGLALELVDRRGRGGRVGDGVAR